MLDSGWLTATGLALLALMLAGEAASAANLYVAPNGKDTWSGKLAAPNAAGTDGPLASLPAAQAAVRKLKQQTKGEQPISVQLRGGTYRIGEPLRFGPEDGGTAEAPIAWEAFAGERPVISGGVPVSGWRKDVGQVMVAEVPVGSTFNQLFVNSRRATRARTPNEGWLRTAGQLPGFEEPNKHRGEAAAGKGFIYRDNDIPPAAADGGWVVLYHSWTNSLHPIESIDPATRQVHFTNRSGWPVGWWERNNQRYHIENLREALDSPGEWYLDSDGGLLYYWPRAGEDLARDEVVAPVATQLLVLAGDSPLGLPVAHLGFRGLALLHTDWQATPDQMLDGQAATFLTGAIKADGARHCVFEDLELGCVGSHGIWLAQGCKDNVIRRCHLHDLAGGGVRLGESETRVGEALSERNTVDNCWIHHAGQVFNGACGILIQRSSHNRLTHNEISDLYYTGISVGWSWGYAESTANHNVIEKNHVHHLGWGVMSDMGGIYCLGKSPGTVVRNNIFHHVLSYSYGGWGMYTDEGSSEIVFENNLVYRTKTGGFHQHYGEGNIIRNNILAFSAEGQVQRSRQEEHLSFTFERNLIYFSQGHALSGGWSNGQFKSDSNLWWRTDGHELDFAGKTLEEWQAAGFGEHSIIADPLFVDPARDDYRLREGSPASKVGFQPFDTSDVGLYGDPAWVNQPGSLTRPEMVFAGPPPPFSLADGFETTPVGGSPAGAKLGNFDSPAAWIKVTDKLAKTGKQCLEIQDAAGLKAEWNPHFYYNPSYRDGVARMSFAIRLGPGAKLYCEWRDNGSPYQVGPSLYFEPDGTLKAGDRVVAKLPVETWIEIAIVCQLGTKSDGTWSLTVTPAGQAAQTFDGLASKGKLRQLHWLGFSSTATQPRTYWLDDLTLSNTTE